jgi:hypothetical protein
MVLIVGAGLAPARSASWSDIRRVLAIQMPLQRIVADIFAQTIETGFIAHDMIVKAALP